MFEYYVYVTGCSSIKSECFASENVTIIGKRRSVEMITGVRREVDIFTVPTVRKVQEPEEPSYDQ